MEWVALTIVILLIIVFVIYYNQPESKKEREKKRLAESAEREKINGYKQKYKCKRTCHFEHLYGLNIPNGATCDVWICSKRLVAYYGAPITLLYTKMIKAEVIDQTQFKKHYIDNATGAIAGGIAFGAVGALLGGGTKTVTEMDKKYILAITYKNENEVRYILFDVTYNKSLAKEFAKEINHRISKNAKEIEL